MPLAEYVYKVLLRTDDPTDPDGPGAMVLTIDAEGATSGRLFFVEPPLFPHGQSLAYGCPHCGGEGKGGCAEAPLPWREYRRAECPCAEECEAANPEGEDSWSPGTVLGGAWVCRHCRGEGENPELFWTVYEVQVGASDGLEDYFEGETVNSICDCVGYPGGPEAFQADYASGDLIKRAFIAESIASYSGWGELDLYPTTYKREDLREFFRDLPKPE